MSLSPSLLYAAHIHRHNLEIEYYNEQLLSSSLKSDKQLIEIKAKDYIFYIPVCDLKNVKIYNVYSSQ